MSTRDTFESLVPFDENTNAEERRSSDVAKADTEEIESAPLKAELGAVAKITHASGDKKKNSHLKLSHPVPSRDSVPREAVRNTTVKNIRAAIHLLTSAGKSALKLWHRAVHTYYFLPVRHKRALWVGVMTGLLFVLGAWAGFSIQKNRYQPVQTKPVVISTPASSKRPVTAVKKSALKKTVRAHSQSNVQNRRVPAHAVKKQAAKAPAKKATVSTKHTKPRARH